MLIARYGKDAQEKQRSIDFNGGYILRSIMIDGTLDPSRHTHSTFPTCSSIPTSGLNIGGFMVNHYLHRFKIK